MVFYCQESDQFDETQLGGILLSESDQFEEIQLGGILLAESDQFVRDNQEIFIL